MSNVFIVDALTLDAQRRASDPRTSAWVSANAGSGKTHVLAQRVKRLLLSGAKPDKILCLTYTKAAAGNMANRILDELATWARMDENELRKVVAALDGRAPQNVSDHELQRARRLFAEALETPGGLKIQTIHAFCEALLHQFPFEAGLAGNFRLIDDLQQVILLNEAFENALTSGDRDIEEAGARLVLEKNLDDLKKDVSTSLPFFKNSFANDDDFKSQLFSSLGLGPEINEKALAQNILRDALAVAQWPEAIRLLKTGKAAEHRIAQEFEQALGLPEDKQAFAYLSVFVTGEKMRDGGSKFLTKDFKSSHPALSEKLLDELQRVEPLYRQFKLLQLADMNLAFATLAKKVWSEIERAKKKRGLVDFDDLITLAGDLLNSESAAWVRYKLDQGVDHILVDEAQDTSEAQWHVISGLRQEFFAGAGASNKIRTLFAVGDDKQSIFSFQGAAPKLFDAQRRIVMRAVENAETKFESVSLNLSFRSSPAVLQAVDDVFSDAKIARGVTAENIFPAHLAAKKNLPGLVELWPLEKPADEKEINAFDHPFEAGGIESPKARLARRIAQEISDSIRAGQVNAGDILILVRTRSALFEALLREMKKIGVPVAGADRLKLAEHIAAMDLMALGDAVLLPEDDLNFAALLKSPLFGFDEDDLFALAYQRKGSLQDALAQRTYEKPLWKAADSRFVVWRQRAAACRPFEFFSQVLGADGGRDQMLHRLGHEAGEVLDEFLNAALHFENSEIPTMQNFLNWLRGADMQIKREMQQGLDEVRVMTVHNAKGLEAKWILLADTADKPGARQLTHFYEVENGHAHATIWAPGEKNSIGLIEEAKSASRTAQDEEYRRLLYVALTRAEQRLTICGAQGKSKLPEDCWYALSAQALEKPENAEYDNEKNILRWAKRFGAIEENKKIFSDEKNIFSVPGWLHTAAVVAVEKRELTPSQDAGFTGEFSSQMRPEALFAKKRGVLLHKLLETLPRLNESARKAAAEKFLSLHAADFEPEQKDDFLQEALRVLPLLEQKNFLGKNALAEVPFSTNITLADGTIAVMNGSIDRLVIEDDALHIIDFKSGRVPETGQIPPNYLTQLARYCEAMRPITGQRTVYSYVLWTEAPRLDVVHENMMGEALAKIA
ncbi:MAG: double-strand break repair helicase AddA [Pseudomonadota bacterium]